jgi:hypothetical protein
MMATPAFTTGLGSRRVNDLPEDIKKEERLLYNM